MPVFDVISGQYPFLEMIVLALPLVDELLINDGGSTDGTLEVLKELAALNDKIKIIEYPHEKGSEYSGLDNAFMHTMKHASGDWIIQFQADEYFPIKFHNDLLEAIRYADENGYSSIRHIRLDVGRGEYANVKDSYQYGLIRVFKNHKEKVILSRDGADCFYFEDEPLSRPDGKYTTHYLPPEYEIEPERFFSLNIFTIFWIDNYIRQQRHCNHYDEKHTDKARYKLFKFFKKQFKKRNDLDAIDLSEYTLIKEDYQEDISEEEKTARADYSHPILDSLLKYNYYHVRKELYDYVKNENLIYSLEEQNV